MSNERKPSRSAVADKHDGTEPAPERLNHEAVEVVGENRSFLAGGWFLLFVRVALAVSAALVVEVLLNAFLELLDEDE